LPATGALWRARLIWVKRQNGPGKTSGRRQAIAGMG
jgi:hypothetical protein